MENSDRQPVMRGFQFRRRENLTPRQRLERFLYDPQTKKICGRTLLQWGQLGLFYVIFFGILAMMCAICYQGLLHSLDKKIPTWTLEDSRIGTSPGLAFRPISENLEDGTLIKYSINNASSVRRWTNLLEKFLKPYYADQVGENVATCDFGKFPKEYQVCRVDAKAFGECNKKISPNYGYDTGSPCIFIKLNRIIKWIPKCYKKPQSGMPKYLNSTIRSLPESHKAQVWVSCKGDSLRDQAHVKNFTFTPPGFAAYYYPYTNEKNYLSPLVAVKIHAPKRNTRISIECRAWAYNINYHGGDVNRQGSVVLELLIIDKPGT